MKKILLICGPAGIGKSTFCRNYIEAHQNEKAIVISADEVRKSITGGYDKFLPNKNMEPVFEKMIDIAHEFAKENKDCTILIDTVLLYDDRRLYFIDKLPEYTYKHLVLCRLKDYEKCLERNKMREPAKVVPEAVIRDMIKSYHEPSFEVSSRFDEITDVYLD
ncbi:MAG: ATP-binding protein [Bacilli bacterium]|nr:ATP-binding protein [Bacilli bacterium]